MANYTEYLNLLKKNPVTEGADSFNIETMLNDNWDKIDAFAKALGELNLLEFAIDSYVGTGEYGEDHPVVIDGLEFRPEFFLVIHYGFYEPSNSAVSAIAAVRPFATSMSGRVHAIWGDSSIAIWSSQSASFSMNAINENYAYIVAGRRIADD